MKEQNLFNGFFIKENHFSVWQEASRIDFKALLSMRKQPLSKEEKEKLPQFGIGKKKGNKKNEQLFPTSFIITELDVPISEKEKLSSEDRFKKWSPQFKEIFEKIKTDEDTKYWAMYLTSSMCGIRFILKTDTPINSKAEYISIARNYLIGLREFGVKEDNIDIAVNQAWYVPTFKNYFDQPRKEIIVLHQNSVTEFNSTFEEALIITKKKEKFIDGNRNIFIHQLACNANRYGIRKFSTLRLIDKYGFNYDPKEIEATLKSVYKSNKSEFGKLKQRLNKNEATVPLNQQIRKQKAMPPIPLIWSGIKKGSVGFIFGPAKSGKSTFCEGLAMSLANGVEEFMGIKINGGPYKVLFISLEEHWQMRAERNGKQKNYLYINHKKRLNDNLISNTEKYPNYIFNEHDLRFIENEIKVHKPQIVFIDSLSRLITDRIEDSSSANKMVSAIKNLASRTKITLVIIHHSTKNRDRGLDLFSMAGSRIIAQEGDFFFGINQVNNTRYLKEINFRYAVYREKVQIFKINEYQWTVPIKLEYEGNILKESDGRTDSSNTDLVLDYIQQKGEVQTGEVIKKFKGTISERTIKNQLSKLIKQGRVERVEKGVYKSSADK